MPPVRRVPLRWGRKITKASKNLKRSGGAAGKLILANHHRAQASGNGQAYVLCDHAFRDAQAAGDLLVDQASVEFETQGVFEFAYIDPLGGHGALCKMHRSYTPSWVSFMRNTGPLAYTFVPTGVTKVIGHVREYHGHVGPEYSLLHVLG